VVAVTAGVNKIHVVATQRRCDAFRNLVVKFKIVQLETPLLSL
jgi:hypothetical protein